MNRLFTAALWTGVGLTWLLGLTCTFLIGYAVWLLALAGLLWLTASPGVLVVLVLPVALLPTALYVWLTVFGNRVPGD